MEDGYIYPGTDDPENISIERQRSRWMEWMGRFPPGENVFKIQWLWRHRVKKQEKTGGRVRRTVDVLTHNISTTFKSMVVPKKIEISRRQAVKFKAMMSI